MLFVKNFRTQFLVIADTKTATLTDSIGKHIYLKKCTLQAFPCVGIIDVTDVINRGIIKLHFDIIIIHVGTNNIWNYNLRNFEKNYNQLVIDVTCFAKRNAKIILSAILPRPVDLNRTKIFVVAVNSLLRNLCWHRGDDFIATYKPFVKYIVNQFLNYFLLCVVFIQITRVI